MRARSSSRPAARPGFRPPRVSTRRETPPEGRRIWTTQCGLQSENRINNPPVRAAPQQADTVQILPQSRVCPRQHRQVLPLLHSSVQQCRQWYSSHLHPPPPVLVGPAGGELVLVHPGPDIPEEKMLVCQGAAAYLGGVWRAGGWGPSSASTSFRPSSSLHKDLYREKSVAEQRTCRQGRPATGFAGRSPGPQTTSASPAYRVNSSEMVSPFFWF